MPRFFFHIHDKGRTIRDEDGLEFASLDDALVDAEKAVEDMMTDARAEGEDLGYQSFEIADAGGVVLARIKFSETSET